MPVYNSADRNKYIPYYPLKAINQSKTKSKQHYSLTPASLKTEIKVKAIKAIKEMVFETSLCAKYDVSPTFRR